MPLSSIAQSTSTYEMPATDSSSAISETRRSNITLRDGGLCVLCGADPVDVAHIVARKAGDTGQEVPFIRNLAPSLSCFRKDDASNLLCLCPLHHRQYDSAVYVFVPSKSQRELLKNYELRDFAHRESLVKINQPDPGRTFPHFSDEVEFIPIRVRQFHAYVHNPTRYDQEMFIFDNVGQCPCPLLHFHASPFCLMVQAQPKLANVMRFQSDQADVAESDVTELLKLYKRHPVWRVDYPIPVPASYSHVRSTIRQSNTHLSSHVLPTNPSSPLRHSASAPSMGHPFSLHTEVPGLAPANTVDVDLHPEGVELAPSLSTTTLDASKDTVDPDMYAQADPQLLEYVKERPVTWDDLKTRPPLFPGEDGGDWQFSSAEQIIRGEWP